MRGVDNNAVTGDERSRGQGQLSERSLAFFGADNVVFASDAPFDPEKGPMYIRETIKIIDNLNISEADRAKIYYQNAQKLLKLKA